MRKFLEKEYFTNWHFKWYRKRPVYWPIQSSKRSYGFVLFHEKITHDTFYAIQREPYLDTKRNAVALQMADLQAGLRSSTGSARKKLEKELDDLRKLADELAEFAKALEAITLGGYEPEPDWIDDGVILRMAPLWQVIPIWKSEPKKYWERLEAGDFDWSHIAMNYWPERARTNVRPTNPMPLPTGMKNGSKDRAQIVRELHIMDENPQTQPVTPANPTANAGRPDPVVSRAGGNAANPKPTNRRSAAPK